MLPLLTDTIGGVGRRFLLGGFLPTALGLLFIFGLILSGAPQTPPTTAALVSTFKRLDGPQAGLLLLTLIGLTLVLQPLQLGMVRLLEGYWPSWKLVAGVRTKRRDAWRAARASDLALQQVQAVPGQPPPTPTEAQVAAPQRLRYRYPSSDRVMPTALGNVLRASEDRAGQRYGLDTVTFWPRLYPHLSDTLGAAVRAQRDQLDQAVRYCLVMGICAVIGEVLLVAHGGWWRLAPLVLVLVSWGSYQAAVQAGIALGSSLDVAFDLHRFDLITALHLQLPDTLAEELAMNRTLSLHFTQGVPASITYLHQAEESPAAGG